MRIIRLTALILLIILAIFQMILPIIRLPFKIEIDYNEGWNAIFCQKAISGEPIYVHPTDWIALNYPPASFYIVGALGRLLGDSLFAGRLISLLSLLAIALGIALIVARQSGSRYASAFAGFLFLGSFGAFATHYVGMDDPQMLGHLFTFGALFIYMLDRSILDKPPRLFFVVLLASLGVFVKQTIVAVPLAITADILIRSRKKLLPWLAMGSLTAGGLACLSFIIWGKGLFSQLLHYPRAFSPTKLLLFSALFGLFNGVPLLVLSSWLRHRGESRPVRVVALYLGIGLTLGIFMSGGYGTDVNVFFDGLIALSLLVGFFISEIERNYVPRFCRRKTVAFTVPFAMTIALLCFMSLKIFLMDGQNELKFGIWRPGVLHALRLSQQASIEDAAFIRQAQSPVICENTLLCFLSHQEFVLDPFFVREAIEKGKIDESDLKNRIGRGFFGVIQMDREVDRRTQIQGPLGSVLEKILSDSLTEDIKKEIAEHYRIVRRSINGVFYVPIDSH
jgi:hypothetical protein